MIRSYATEIARELFEGNWSVFPKRQALEPLEDCFIDLRILDAAATTKDLQVAFDKRLIKSNSGKGTNSYIIHEPSTCPFKYRIEFHWSGSDADTVDVKLSPSGEAEE